jgi:ubiquinone/menaquinone biosynthesis C-methylase UbiE
MVNLASQLVHKLNLARSGVYFLEALPLTLASRWFAHPEMPQPTPEQISGMWRHILRLHQQEAQHVVNGDIPLNAIEIENPLRHLRSYLEVLGDGVQVALRMRQKKSKSFSREALSMQKDLPEYYTRNFHFQTDGYLSEASARRYDHQVEILFSGTAASMRRLILPIIKRHSSGAGHWLELGSGTGSATRPALQTFPEAKVTALDLSSPYLKVAQDNLRSFHQVDFVQGDATNLNFKSQTFDVVFSVYVLHELPEAERRALMREAFRVLKPGGLLVLADSLQHGDEPELNWALERFPKTYHEPFYRNYSEHDLVQMVKNATGCEPHSSHEFLTKVVWVQKPPSSALS